jgi:hypothetical protein
MTRFLQRLEQLERLGNALGGLGGRQRVLGMVEVAPGVYAMPNKTQRLVPSRLLVELEQGRRVVRQVRDGFDAVKKVLR